MSTPAILPDSRSVISSPGSEGGATPCGLQAGMTPGQSGPGAAPASHSARRAKGKASKMIDTFGQNFDVSSPSARLQLSLENRLRARTAAYGSPEYELIWKHWPMLSGPPICALRASALRTLGSGCGGWPTPMAGSPASETYNEAGNTDSSRKTVALVGWNTPRATDGSNGGPNQTGGGALSADAALAGWPSPKASNNTGSGQRGSGGENLQTCASRAGYRLRRATVIAVGKQNGISKGGTPCG